MAEEKNADARQGIGLENPADKVNGVGLSNLTGPAPAEPDGGAVAKEPKAQVGAPDPDRSEKGSRRKGRSATNRRADEGESVGRGRGG